MKIGLLTFGKSNSKVCPQHHKQPYTSKWHDMCDDVCTHHTRTRSPPSHSWSSACASSDQCRHCEVTDAQCITIEIHSQRIFHNLAKRHPYEMFVVLGQHVLYTMIAVTRHACNTPCQIVGNRTHTLTTRGLLSIVLYCFQPGHVTHSRCSKTHFRLT